MRFGFDGSKSGFRLHSSSRLLQPELVTASRQEVCGDVPNRLDVSQGWNFPMRIYRPGPSVLDGTYKLLKVAEPMTKGAGDK